MNETINHAKTASKTMPSKIGLDKWSDIGFEWVGDVAVSDFERLSAQIVSPDDENSGRLCVKATLKKESDILWLSFAVSGALMLSCQRCLEPMAVDVTGDYRLAILTDETQIDSVQDAEYVLIDELGTGRMLPIKDLLEDELLLVLPLSPRHDDCQMPAEMDEEIEDETTDNPFAVLAALKGQLS